MGEGPILITPEMHQRVREKVKKDIEEGRMVKSPQLYAMGRTRQLGEKHKEENPPKKEE
jgi:hypothetical protein